MVSRGVQNMDFEGYCYVKFSYFLLIVDKMYDLTMDAVNEHLMKRTSQRKLLYTSELVPEGPNSNV